MYDKVDSHQHFWRVARGDYPWMSPDVETLYRDYLPEDLRPLLREARVAQTVIVQAAPTVDETWYMLDVAAGCDFVAGVVGWIDLDSPCAAHELQALSAARLLKGIRPMIEFIPDPDWMLSARVHASLDALSESDLCFDALVRPLHLGRLDRLIGEHPRLRVVVDHGAKPDIARGSLHAWNVDLARIARHPHVFCKLSGLLTEAAPGAGLEQLEPCMRHIVGAFGTERVMWGSDWPVLNMAGDYSGWSRLCERFLEPFGERACQAIFMRNAREFYRL